METPRILKALGSELSRLAKEHQLAVIPGGGKFADIVRELDSRFQLPATVSHWMAILGMDQYGLLLSQVIACSEVCDSLRAAKEISQNGRAAILQPTKMLRRFDPFEPSWDVTSDSIAAYIAYKLNAATVVFVTDVDGIFTANPKEQSKSKLFSQVSIEELLKFSSRTSVDKFLPVFLSAHMLDCYVVNGRFPERVTRVLSGQETIATHIQPIMCLS